MGVGWACESLTAILRHTRPLDVACKNWNERNLHGEVETKKVRIRQKVVDKNVCNGKKKMKMCVSEREYRKCCIKTRKEALTYKNLKIPTDFLI